MSQTSYLTKTLNAPSGVTKIAGANAYAEKFAISPTITEKKNMEKLILKVKMIPMIIQNIYNIAHQGE